MNQWIILKDICTGKMIASTSIWIFIVPAVTKVFNLIESSTPVIGGVNLVAPQNLIILYFSAIAFFLSSLIYTLFCPDLIKKYSSFTDYQSEGKNEVNLTYSLKHLNGKSSKQLFDKLEKNIERASPDDVNKSLDATISIGKQPLSFTFKKEYLSEVYWTIYEYFSGYSIYAQIISWVLLVIGFILLAFILFANLYLVVLSI